MADTVLQEGQTLDWKLAYGSEVLVAAGKKNDTSGSACTQKMVKLGCTRLRDRARGAGLRRWPIRSWASGMPMSSSNGQGVDQTPERDSRALWRSVRSPFGRGRFAALGIGPGESAIGRRQFWFVSSADGVDWQSNAASTGDPLD